MAITTRRRPGDAWACPVRQFCTCVTWKKKRSWTVEVNRGFIQILRELVHHLFISRNAGKMEPATACFPLTPAAAAMKKSREEITGGASAVPPITEDGVRRPAMLPVQKSHHHLATPTAPVLCDENTFSESHNSISIMFSHTEIYNLIFNATYKNHGMNVIVLLFRFFYYDL